jgi:hypothetical protein
MILFFSGMATLYLVIGLIVWLLCRKDVVLNLRTQAALTNKTINPIYLEFVVLTLCLGWPYVIASSIKEGRHE